VITEPEMEQGPEPLRAAEVLAGGDRPERGRRPGGGRLPWLWALGGAVLACAVGAAVLDGIGYGRDPAPDLHGYHLGSSLCTGQNLQPLTDALAAQTLTAVPGATRHGAAVDHAACALFASAPGGDGWRTEYTVSLTVDLHKKTDPQAEFEDDVHQQAVGPTPGSGVPLSQVMAFDGAVVRPFPGLGDRAFLTTSRSHQSLSVQEGGAVLTLTVDATNEWEASGAPPDETDGSASRPPLADTTALRPVLPGTVRHLMGVLAR
jgi:hypothetical protein